jgi:hypothetical protein
MLWQWEPSIDVDGGLFLEAGRRRNVPTIERLRIRLAGFPGIAMAATLAGLLAAPAPIAFAQQPTPGAQSAAGAPEDAPKLPMDQLESLVAPIALFPDPLLAQMLVASTYPLDVVAAQQWLDKNKNLKGDELTKAAEKQPWDPSVQAMVVIPDALKKLAENIAWTQDLGDAFLAQQQDVMEAVQALRKKAKDAGKLDSTEQQKVETTTVESKTVIEIQPTSTQVVYVPQYNPVAYWPAPVYPYPPVYYPPYYPGAALVSFGVGIAVGAAISGGWGWGCGWGGGNTININNNNNFNRNNNRTNNINRSGNSNWQHNASQRGGAPYKDRATANKYGGGARGDSAGNRSAQAQSRQASGGARGGDRAGGSAGGGAGGGNFDRSRSGGGGNNVGNRSVSPSTSSRSSSSAFGGSQSGSQARSSSSRGSSSMSGSRGGGGGSRGGGGGGRRR